MVAQLDTAALGCVLQLAALHLEWNNGKQIWLTSPRVRVTSIDIMASPDNTALAIAAANSLQLAALRINQASAQVLKPPHRNALTTVASLALICRDLTSLVGWRLSQLRDLSIANCGSLRRVPSGLTRLRCHNCSALTL